MIKSISDSLDQFVAKKRISGAVSLVAQKGKIIHLAATGVSDLQTQRPMQTDDLFWVASMTKPISAAAVMVLVDEGKLSVDDPVEKYLPEFAQLWLVKEKSDTEIRLVRPHRSIRLHDLLCHTHGLANVPSPDPEASLAEHVRAIAGAGMDYEPGSAWVYGNSGMSALGRVVEVVSGESFQDFLLHRFFQPLGMKETTFFPREEDLGRLAKTYIPSADNMRLEEIGISSLPGNLTSTKRTVAPGGGLFSTAFEMHRFYQMLANGGTLDNRRYLSEGALHEMTRTQTGELKAGLGEGMTYGFGVNVVTAPPAGDAPLSQGTYGHDGAAGTSAFVDPRRGLVMIHLLQRRNLWDSTGEGGAMKKAFQAAVIEAVDTAAL